MEDLTPEERMDVELSTVIDPFKPPKPWVRKTLKNRKVVYYNEVTKEQQSHHPGQVWSEKYTKLEQLTPRYHRV